MIMLKVTKNQGFTLSLEDAFFEEPQTGKVGGTGGGGGGGVILTPQPLGLTKFSEHLGL